MNRRDFLFASTAAGLAWGACGGARAEAKPGKQLLELRLYRLASAEKQQAFDEFLARAAIPALHRLGIGPVGVFKLTKEDNPKPKMEIDFNTLCISCHAGGENEATIIDVGNHMFHEPGTKGWRCVDCHMQKTPYMGRDPRSDHMFPVPDPVMTKELGIPNACDSCHADKGIDWQIEWMDKWYGDKMKKYEPRRERTRAVAAAHNAERGALGKLIRVYDVEEIAAWRATLLRLSQYGK